MDYDPSAAEGEQGGSDGCVDFEDVDNTGLDGCVHKDENSLQQVYSDWCEQVSLADFIVIAAEAVMSASATSPIDFATSFKYGRSTSATCSFNHGRLPTGSDTCTEVEETFVDRLGLSWAETAALMGVHTIGRTNPDNSGFSGWWSDGANQQIFNNDYYRSIMLKGWTPKDGTNWGYPNISQVFLLPCRLLF